MNDWNWILNFSWIDCIVFQNGGTFYNLDLHHWGGETSPSNTSDKITDIIKNHEKHPSISKFGQFLLKKSKRSLEILRLAKLSEVNTA